MTTTPPFDPATFSYEQLHALNNVEGKSLLETNTPEQIAAAQAMTPKTTITPESLKNTQQFPLVSPTPVPPYSTASLPTIDPLTPTATETKESGISTELGSLYTSLIGKSADQKAADSKYGVDEAQKSITDLNAQLTGLKNEALAIPLNLQNNSAGISTSVLGAMTDAQLRTNAVKALSVSSLLAASQGQLANAQALANKAVAQKYDPIQEKIAALQANLKLISEDPATSLEDKNRAQKQLLQQQAHADAVALEKTNATEVWNIATTAAGNGTNFKASTQYPSLSLALQAISNAPTKEQALQIAISTGLLSGAKTAASTSIVNTNGHSYLINDLTGERIKDLGVANSEISSGGDTVAGKLQKSISSMSNELQGVAGSDGYVSPDSYIIAKRAWVNAGYASSEFDKAFSIYRNPDNPNYRVD